MSDTRQSLLKRLRRPEEKEAWSRFVDLYTPLLFYWARRMGLQTEDASDLVQEIFAVLVQKMPKFEYQPGKSFRSWLRTVTLNKWREKQRRLAPQVADGQTGLLADLAAPEEGDLLSEAEYRDHLVAQVMKLMREEFQPTTWQACWESVVSGKPAGKVASELGISIGAVYTAKSRVLRRMRQELEGLLE